MTFRYVQGSSLLSTNHTAKIIRHLPKGLYGAELWNSLTPSQEEALERAHRFCVKFIQGLPKQTRSDIALGILGANPIMAEIDKKKLIFFGQLFTTKY